jgi:hypothetical protein
MLNKMQDKNAGLWPGNTELTVGSQKWLFSDSNYLETLNAEN